MVSSDELSPALEGREQPLPYPASQGSPARLQPMYALSTSAVGITKITWTCFLQSFPMDYASPDCTRLGNLLLSYHI